MFSKCKICERKLLKQCFARFFLKGHLTAIYVVSNRRGKLFLVFFQLIIFLIHFYDFNNFNVLLVISLTGCFQK